MSDRFKGTDKWFFSTHFFSSLDRKLALRSVYDCSSKFEKHRYSTSSSFVIWKAFNTDVPFLKQHWAFRAMPSALPAIFETCHSIFIGIPVTKLRPHYFEVVQLSSKITSCYSEITWHYTLSLYLYRVVCACGQSCLRLCRGWLVSASLLSGYVRAKLSNKKYHYAYAWPLRVAVRVISVVAIYEDVYTHIW